MTGRDGPDKLTPEQRAVVLEQVAERRRRNDERVAELGLLKPEAIAASLREVEDRRRAKAAERAGQLDLGGNR